MEPHEIHRLANLAGRISLGTELEDWAQVHKGLAKLVSWLNEERERAQGAPGHHDTVMTARGEALESCDAPANLFLCGPSR